MPLYRVTCPFEERYIVAADLTSALAIATAAWAKAKVAAAMAVVVRVECVKAEDPWK